MGGPGSGRRPWLTPAQREESRQRSLRRHRDRYADDPERCRVNELVAATKGEVTSYTDRWGVEWIAVCRVCGESRDSFRSRVDGASWLVEHRAEWHALSPGSRQAVVGD